MSSLRTPLRYGAAIVMAAAVTLALLGTLLVPAGARPTSRSSAPAPCGAVDDGLCKLDHLIFIVQENRSFDHYFGTYTSPSGEPVDGLKRTATGKFRACLPNPAGGCSRPYHSTNFRNLGGPHSNAASIASVNGGKMNGFLQPLSWHDPQKKCLFAPKGPGCRNLTGPKGQPDAISFHTRAEIPSYWAYADWGVLQDRMFAPVDSWSLPAHLFLVSGWAAACSDPMDPMSCRSDATISPQANYPWTDITYLLWEHGVDWGYYVGNETNLECGLGEECPNNHKPYSTPKGWNPLLWFNDVAETGQTDNIQHHSDFFDALEDDTLPSVVWIIPGGRDSEHPGHGSLGPGQRYLTQIVNALVQDESWDSSAIFITWDDWGGFYDHVEPPRVDELGYGIRVPGMMLSPYAKEAYVDHQTLSFDAYLKFIEDRFANGERLDPATLTRPDSRENVRETEAILGDLSNEFDFSLTPRDGADLVLPLPPVS